MSPTTNDDGDPAAIGRVAINELEDIGHVMGTLGESDEGGIPPRVFGKAHKRGLVFGITWDDEITGESVCDERFLKAFRLRLLGHDQGDKSGRETAVI